MGKSDKLVIPERKEEDILEKLSGVIAEAQDVFEGKNETIFDELKNWQAIIENWTLDISFD